MSSFQSPLLSSLRKPGTQGTSEVTTPSNKTGDVDALGRERRDGIPSRLGFPPRSSTPLVKTPRSTTPGASLTPGGSSSIGTNFKQRLRAMQSTQSEYNASPLRPYGNSNNATTSGSLGGGGGGGGVKPASPAPPRIISALLQGPRREGTPPPSSSLEDEMQRLQVASTSSVSDNNDPLYHDATPTKTKTNVALSCIEHSQALPLASTPGTPATDTTTAGAQTAFEFGSASRPTQQQWTPMVNSASKSSRKAVGAGALSRLGNTNTATTAQVEADFKEVPVQQPQKPLVSSSSSTYRAAAATAATATSYKPSTKIRSQGVDNAHSLQRQLRSTLPDFGVAEWTAPISNSSQGEHERPVTLGDEFQRKKAMAELAILQREAQQALNDATTEARCAGVEKETAALALAMADVAKHTSSSDSLRTSGTSSDSKGRSTGQQQQMSPGVSERLERLRCLQTHAAQVVGTIS